MQTGKAISVPAILKVGNGTLNQLGSYLKGEGLKQVVIFLGNGLIDMFGETVMESLKKEEITVLEYSELDTVDIDDIITLAFSMPNKTLISNLSTKIRIGQSLKLLGCKMKHTKKGQAYLLVRI